MRIGGDWVESKSGEKFEVRNPATSELLSTVPSGTREDVISAIDLAAEAFEVWSEFDPVTRSKILMKGAERVRSRKEDLVVPAPVSVPVAMVYERPRCMRVIDRPRVIVDGLRRHI